MSGAGAEWRRIASPPSRATEARDTAERVKLRDIEHFDEIAAEDALGRRVARFRRAHPLRVAVAPAD
jgi:hypothetical protein